MAYKTLSDVYADVRFLTGTDSTSVEDSDLLRISNKYFRTIMRALVDLGQDMYGEISTFDLVANQQEYTSPIDSATTPFGGGLIKILRVEAAIDGTNWYVLDSVKVEEIEKATNSVANVNAQFNASSPSYSYFDRNMFLNPIPTANVTAGGRIFYVKRPAEMTVATDVPEIPADFLDILSLGIQADVYQSLGNDKGMTDSLNRFNSRIAEMRAQESNNDTQDPPRFIPAGISYK